jgi:PHP family Zn ribbon phosphoesterase
MRIIWWRKNNNMDETPEDFEKLDAAILAESKKSPVQTVLICPQCGSKNVTYCRGLKARFASTSARTAAFTEPEPNR